MPLFQGNGDLGTLGSLKAESRATKYDKSAIFGQKDRELYMLVVVDTTGSPVRPATDDDLRGVDLGVDGTHESQGGPVRTNEPKSKQRSRNSSFQDLLAAARNDIGPSCAHCGVTESPQWRKGPDDKPVLCNACGTRYRRTGNLGPMPAWPSKKRPLPAFCAQEAAAGENLAGISMKRAGKEPRLVVS